MSVVGAIEDILKLKIPPSLLACIWGKEGGGGEREREREGGKERVTKN